MKLLRVLLPAILLALLVALAACGGDDDEDKKAQTATTQTTPTSATGENRLAALRPEALSGKTTPAKLGAGKTIPQTRAVGALNPQERREIRKLTVRRRGAAAGVDTGADPNAPPGQDEPPGPDEPAPDKDKYDAFMEAVIPLIQKFWQTKTPQLSPTKAKYEAPGRLARYTSNADAPGCHGEKSEDMTRNAFYCNVEGNPDECKTVSSNGAYCSGGDIIAWDEAGLMFPFYKEIGDLATGLVMAHEWGHLVQFRLYPAYFYETTIRRELQADCYAGAWATEMNRQGRVDVGEFNEALGLFYEIGGDAEAWLDPESHGNKFQRVRAFTQGFEEDAEGCVGKKFDAMLKRIGLEPENNEGGPSTTPSTTPTTPPTSTTPPTTPTTETTEG